MPADVPERRGFEVRRVSGWPITAPSWMAAAFLVAFVLAVIVLAIFGGGNRGTELALRVTARWSFLFFLGAYAGSAMAWAFGPNFNGLARRGRELGLAFASAQLVHVGLVLWLYYIAAGPSGAMVFFWVGIFCTYLLVLFSWPRLRDALGPRVWPLVRMIAIEYIALAFAADFILGRLQADGPGKFPVTYLPFALVLVGGAGLRIAAYWDRKSRYLRETFALIVPGPPKASQFGGFFREDRQIVWLFLSFVGVVFILLALDGALSEICEAALALYGPCIVVLAVYALLKLAVFKIKFIGSQLK
jgi:hypothetical protein